VDSLSATFDLERDGARLLEGGAVACLADMGAVLAGHDQREAGVRLFGMPRLASFLDGTSHLGGVARSFAGATARPVRAILFDKNSERNWPLAWHQDRAIAVRTRINVPGYGPWTRKAGVEHVAPPSDLLRKMLTMRIHLDDVPADNAPLLIAVGSHRAGVIREADLDAVVRASVVHPCTAARGDVWLYRTLILHASERAAMPSRRRVLQVDYSPDELPDGLEWLGL
jgi:hypothetical protein